MKWLLIIFTLILPNCSERRSLDANSISATHRKSIDEPMLSNEKSLVEYKHSKKDSIIVRECNYMDLSYSFDFKLKYKKFKNIDGIHDSCIVQVNIIDKKSQLHVDSVYLSSIYYLDPIFQNCNNVLSYSTGKNSYAVDFEYPADFIIVDINFDLLEDIVLINDFGGNGGTCYNFYIQDLNKHFHLDKFLTEKMMRFPKEINEKTKTLVTLVHANAYQLSKTTYRFDNKNNWIQLEEKLIP